MSGSQNRRVRSPSLNRQLTADATQADSRMRPRSSPLVRASSPTNRRVSNKFSSRINASGFCAKTYASFVDRHRESKWKVGRTESASGLKESSMKSRQLHRLCANHFSDLLVGGPIEMVPVYCMTASFKQRRLKRLQTFERDHESDILGGFHDN